MEKEWMEDLPDLCPPETAKPSKNMYYRLVATIPPTMEDFSSNRKLFPEKVFPGVSECIARACSLFDNIQSCKKQKKHTRFKKKDIIGFVVDDSVGVVDKTRSEGHYSWWIKRIFDPAELEFEVIDD